MTLSEAVLDISARDFQPGPTYVATSRLGSLQGILFETPFDLNALQTRDRANFDARVRDSERRREQRFLGLWMLDDAGDLYD